MKFDNWVKLWGQNSGKEWEKKLSNWGKEEYLMLSTESLSYAQSYPHAFPRLHQRLVHESTGSTTTTVFINIY